MANIVRMQRAIKEFFDYLLRNTDLIPEDNFKQVNQAANAQNRGSHLRA